MEHQQIHDKAEEFITALHTLEKGGREEANQLAALFAPKAVLTNSALERTHKKMEGEDAILRFWVEYKDTLGEAYSEFHHITVSGKAAGLFWTTKGHTPDGEDASYHGATLLEWDETGKIVFFRGYYDTRELTVKAEA